MNATQLISEAQHHGARLAIVDGKLKATPPGVLPPELKAELREHAPEIRALLTQPAAELARAAALEVLSRLRCYTLPAGRMPAARALARRLEPLLRKPDFDPSEALAVLRGIERELIALGGAPDPELAEAVAMVQQTFPDARLVEVKKPQGKRQ